MKIYLTEILHQVCTDTGISMVGSNSLISSQCVKRADNMKDEVIDFTTPQMQTTSKYFTMEAFKEMTREGI